MFGKLIFRKYIPKNIVYAYSIINMKLEVACAAWTGTTNAY